MYRRTGLGLALRVSMILPFLLAHRLSFGQQQEPSCVVLGDSSGAPHSPQNVSTDQGTITVGCPKLWVSDRIFTVLDGLLRDVDSINLKSLQGLDPNSVTGAELLSIANEFQANLKYDQGAAVGNAFKLQKANVQRASDMKAFDAQQKSNEAIHQRKQLLQERALSLQEKEYQLTAAGKDDQDPEMKKVKAEEKVVSDQLTALNSLETAPTIQDQTISSNDTTQAAQATTTTQALDADALQKAFGSVLQNPKLPAAMQMDNVIDLLRQRLAREFGVMYDDLSRQSSKYDLYLAQFDIGLLAGRRGKKQHPRVTIRFDDENERIVAYDLFPAGAAYNTATGQAKTTRIGISGTAQTLFGFGLSAAFNHSRNQLRSSLSQTMYVAGFGAGSSEFGWTFGTAPFEDYISPGSRSVFAVLLVPKSHPLHVSARLTTCWVSEGRGRSTDCARQPSDPIIRFGLPDSDNGLGAPDPGNSRQRLLLISYRPLKQSSSSSGTTAAATAAATTTATTTATTAPTTAPSQPTSNTVQLVFSNPIDPNMTITADDTILRRVRDVRGRALYGSSTDTTVLAGNQAERDALNKSRFGLLESDTLEDDSWFQVNSTTVLLNIARKTAGTDLFPLIRISDPRLGGRDITSMVTRDDPEVRIGQWSFHGVDRNAKAAFLPLFADAYDPGRIEAYVDRADPGGSYPTLIRIVSETRREGRARPVWLHEHAEVLLRGQGDPWALNCLPDEGTLVCNMPSDDAFRDESKNDFRIFVDEPPNSGRPGFWANTELRRPHDGWKSEPYALSDWGDVSEVEDSWSARISIKNLEDKKYCLVGIPDVDTVGKRIRSLQKDSSQAGEVRLLQQMVRSSNLAGLANGAVGRVGDCPNTTISVQKRQNEDLLTLSIPFNQFPYVLGHISLEPRDCRDCTPIPLPGLRSHLQPGPVTLTDLGQGDYRLEGSQLKAVQKVRLRRGAIARDFVATAGVNSLGFALNEKPDKRHDKKLESGTWNIFLLIGDVPIPAEDDQKKLQQLVLVIPPEKNNAKADVTKADVTKGDVTKADVTRADVTKKDDEKRAKLAAAEHEKRHD
jgi:hypothetical protein